MRLPEIGYVRLIVGFEEDHKNVLQPYIIFRETFLFGNLFTTAKSCGGWLDDEIDNWYHDEGIDSYLEGKEKSSEKVYEIVGLLCGEYVDCSSWEYPNSEYEFCWELKNYNITEVHEEHKQHFLNMYC